MYYRVTNAESQVVRHAGHIVQRIGVRPPTELQIVRRKTLVVNTGDCISRGVETT